LNKLGAEILGLAYRPSIFLYFEHFMQITPENEKNVVKNLNN
jgi:hypothetical protein